jgi:Tfp pilus assembly protein FimT
MVSVMTHNVYALNINSSSKPIFILIRQKFFGFSTLELICIFCVLSILAMLSGSAWSHYSSAIHFSAELRKVKSAVAFARNQAILQQKTIEYCGSSDLKQCDGHWHDGQIIVRAADKKILKVYTNFDRKLTLNFNANFGRNDRIEFLPNGFSHGQNGHFSVCMQSKCRYLIMHFSGEAIERDTGLAPANMLE